MWDWLGHSADIVYSWGYIGIFIALIIEGLGLPFPGDAVMAFYGVAAAAGKFHPVPLIVTSILGYLIGALTAYGVSRRYGAAWIDRMAAFQWLNNRGMTRTSSLIDRYGPILLVPGRFLPGVRSASSYVAGLVRMEFSDFLVYTSIGVIVWCSLWVMIGFWFGEYLDAIFAAVQSSFAYATGGFLVLAVGVWWMLRLRKAR